MYKGCGKTNCSCEYDAGLERNGWNIFNFALTYIFQVCRSQLRDVVTVQCALENL